MNRVAKVIWNELVPVSPVFSTADVMRRTGMALSNASRDLPAAMRLALENRGTLRSADRSE